jgi:hypothetical protein
VTQEQKKDLTSPKNLVNYLIYTFAGVISILYFSGEKKSTAILENSEQSLKNCEEEKKESQKINTKLLLNAYKIKDEEIKKKANEIDSISVENIKEQTAPHIEKINSYRKKEK